MKVYGFPINFIAQTVLSTQNTENTTEMPQFYTQLLGRIVQKNQSKFLLCSL